GTHAPVNLGPRKLFLFEAEGHVAVNGQMGEQGVMLENGVDVAVVRREGGGVFPVNQDFARLGLLKTRDQPEERRLATPARAEQSQEFTAPDRKCETLKRRVLPVALADVQDRH